jgi:hypothetical protein
MFRNILEKTDWLIYIAIISLVVFFVIYLIIVLKTIFLKKSFIKEMGELPLESNNKEEPI